MWVGGVVSILGLGSDIVGAYLLAYDTMWQPGVTFQRKIAEERMRFTETQMEYFRESYRQLPPETGQRLLARVMPDLESRLESDRALLSSLPETHERKAQRSAERGFNLLMGGFALQALGTVI